MSPYEAGAAAMREMVAKFALNYGELSSSQAEELCEAIRALSPPIDPASGEGADARTLISEKIRGMNEQGVVAIATAFRAHDAQIATLQAALEQIDGESNDYVSVGIARRALAALHTSSERTKTEP